MDLGIQGRAGIITGASRGVGLQVALALAAEGVNLMLCARNATDLAAAGERVAEIAGPRGAKVISTAIDITDPDAGDRLATACENRFGAVDILVNNAGASSAIPLDRLGEKDWEFQWKINVMATMRLMQAVAPGMARRGWGRIVNVCSSSGKRPSGTNVAYAATKAAELSLSRAYADAFASQGVAINAVAPGALEGAMWLGKGGLADQVAKLEDSDRDTVLAAARAKLPRGKFGSQDEVAAVIAFLCSTQAANVSGAAWSVDGGAVPVII